MNYEAFLHDYIQEILHPDLDFDVHKFADNGTKIIVKIFIQPDGIYENIEINLFELLVFVYTKINQLKLEI